MKNIIALFPIYTEDSNNLKKASINSPYELNSFNTKWGVPKEFRSDVIGNNDFDTNPLSNNEQKDLFNFFKDFIQNYAETLPKAIVIDFGIIKGKDWALIEANPAWCSGLYACDAEKTLEVIVDSCIKN